MKLITEYNSDIIRQYIETENSLNHTIEKLLEEILCLKEDHVHQALINLGWTPPKEEPKNDNKTIS